MLVEHTFVTTHPFPTVVVEADEVLRLAGYRVSWICSCGKESAISLPHCNTCHQERRTDGGRLLGVRGTTNPAQARRIMDLPQRVQIEYERGRISLAASIMEKRKVESIHRELMLALVRLIEQSLVTGPTPEALQNWQFVVSRVATVDADESRRRRNGCLIAILVVILIIVLISILAVAINN